MYPRENGTPMKMSRAPKVKPEEPLTLAAKRAGITPTKRRAPVVLLNSRSKKKPVVYKSQDMISNSGSEDEKEEINKDGDEDGKMDEDDA